MIRYVVEERNHFLFFCKYLFYFLSNFVTRFLPSNRLLFLFELWCNNLYTSFYARLLMKHPVYLISDYARLLMKHPVYLIICKDNDETPCISAYARIMMKHPVYLYICKDNDKSYLLLTLTPSDRWQKTSPFRTTQWNL